MIEREQLNVDYKLTGTGWAECVITIGTSTCTASASYLSDCLHDFIEAVCSILKGAESARFSFNEEPGEYRWILNSRPQRKLEVNIIEFSELWGEQPDSEGKIIFQGTCEKNDFAMALKQSLDKIINTYGLKGYKEKWVEHEFPVNSYKNLCALINHKRKI